MAKRRKSGIQRRERASEEALNRRIDAPSTGIALPDWRLLAIGGVLVVGVILIILVLIFGSGPAANAGVQQPDDGTTHVAVGVDCRAAPQSDPNCGTDPYSSLPATSGPHWDPSGIANWGLYTTPMPETQLIHNLEHGGIVIQYGDVGEDTVKDIQSFYEDDPNGLVVAPYSKLGKKIALTAWNAPRYPQDSDLQDIDTGNGYVMTCTQWDEAAASEFRDERRNKAGERFPSVADMAPGT